MAHSTFVDNTSGSALGEGIASYGNPAPEDEESDPPPATIFTTLTHSVVYRQGGSSDVDVVGDAKPFAEEIVLDAANVRIGPSLQSLSSRLDDWANGTNYNHPIGDSFIEQLTLGDLWS